MTELLIAAAVAILALIMLRLGRLSLLGRKIVALAMLFFTLETLLQAASYIVGGGGFNEAVFYHLIYGLEGAGVGQFRLAILRTLGALTLWFFSIWGILFWKRFEQRFGQRLIPGAPRTRIVRYLGLVSLTASITVHPVVVDAWHTFYPSAKVQPLLNSYVVPAQLNVPSNKPNLVIIYLESVERTYFNETTFPGLITQLRDWEKKSLSFTNIRQTFGTGWTIGGMVASQCGIPLVPKGIDLARIEEKNAERNEIKGSLFIPGATCLGDLLLDAGYHSVYMGGASGAFAGKTNFYRTHGFNEFYGKFELLDKLPDPSYASWWGLRDDSLFDLVEQKFQELYAGDKPFALVTLTLDTHGGDDMPYSKSCRTSPPIATSNLNLRAVACTDQLVGELLTRLRKLDVKRNTYLVVMSDHLAMENTASYLLKKHERRNLFFINAPDGSLHGENQRLGSTLSNGVTVLDAAGFNLPALGLGRSLLRHEKTLEEQHGESFYSVLVAWAPEIRKFWDFSRVARKNGNSNKQGG